MPSFLATKAQFTSARSSIDAVISSIAGKHFLGNNGYYVVIRVDINSPKVIKVRMVGPDTEINAVPTKTLLNYMQVKKEIQEWKDGTLPDFPDFTTRF